MDWDLNCDAGEGESWPVQRALFAAVTSVNLACGGHAGGGRVLEAALSHAQSAGLRLGAHPGLATAFGRGDAGIDEAALRHLLDRQVGHWSEIATGFQATLHHLKLHGSLYHQVNNQENLASALLDWMRTHRSTTRLFAPPKGHLIRLAPRFGIEVWPELFLDRAYEADGGLTSRQVPGAILSDPDQAEQRLREWRASGRVQSRHGSWLVLPGRTWCVHGDTQGAAEVARRAREVLEQGFSQAVAEE